MSVSVSYISAVLEMRQIIDGTSSSTSFRIAFGGKYSSRATWQVKKKPVNLSVSRFKEQQPVPGLSAAVVGAVYSTQHFSLVAGRQKCQRAVTATL